MGACLVIHIGIRDRDGKHTGGARRLDSAGESSNTRQWAEACIRFAASRNMSGAACRLISGSSP
jgi:hypothetical protein